MGYDNVDLEYLNQNNIALGVTGTSNAVSVAEHVLASFLYLTKNIKLSDDLTRSGGFKNKSSLNQAKKFLICLGIICFGGACFIQFVSSPAFFHFAN